MNLDAVVVIRDESDADIIGMLAGEQDGVVHVQHPHYIQYSSTHNSIMMVPYCVFTDETFFLFTKDKLKFVVPSSRAIAKKYMEMLYDRSSDDQEVEPDPGKIIVSGTDTKH